jgi:hypothetical protein
MPAHTFKIVIPFAALVARGLLANAGVGPFGERFRPVPDGKVDDGDKMLAIDAPRLNSEFDSRDRSQLSHPVTYGKTRRLSGPSKTGKTATRAGRAEWPGAGVTGWRDSHQSR